MSGRLQPQQCQHLRRLLETGLPLLARPYQALAEQIGADECAVLEQMLHWQTEGLFRRVGLVLKHRALGFCANAMLVLDVPDAQVDEVGRQLGQAPGINLCYQRPRRLPEWRYNLFCMIHGRQREQVQAQIAALLQAHQLGELAHRVLFSSRAFKQCGGRYVRPAAAESAHG
jgi:DNA-binding Lrp family transcriptional regulator